MSVFSLSKGAQNDLLTRNFVLFKKGLKLNIYENTNL